VHDIDHAAGPLVLRKGDMSFGIDFEAVAGCVVADVIGHARI
jgi:hypothetical protein